MNAIQRLSWVMFGTAAIVLTAVSSRAAVMTIDTTEPTGAAVVAQTRHSTFTSASPGPLGERDTFTTAFASPTFGSRGQTWTMPDNPDGATFDLSGVTIRTD